MAERMNLKELAEKIDTFLTLNDELREYGMSDVTHDTPRGYLQAYTPGLVDIAKEYGLKLVVVHKEPFPWDVSVKELKMFGIATDEELKGLGLHETEVK